MSEKEVDVYSYTLSIQSIKMKVKFPCKMKLEYNGEIITQEVSPSETGKFIFNQEVTFKENLDKPYFELLVNLATDKGAKYVAGVIKIVQEELVQQEGELIVLQIARCLDHDASCELRVDQVSSEKMMKKIGIEKIMIARNRVTHQHYSPQKEHLFADHAEHSANGNNIASSKSEFQFPISNNRRIKNKEEGNMTDRLWGHGNVLKRSAIVGSHMERNIPEFNNLDANNRDKLIEAEVFKENYQKLKEKYRKEAETAKQELNKRMALENNENNFKLEIMKLKLRTEDQEKTIIEKNGKIKQMQSQLTGLQKKELDLSYFKEENSNKDHAIKMLEDTVRTLNKDNEDLKNLNKERFNSEQEKLKDLRSELESTKLKYEGKILELEKENREKVEVILQKESELRVKEERVQREHLLIEELEKDAKLKGIEFEKMLLNVQNENKSKVAELRKTIERLEKEKLGLEESIEGLKSEQEKTASYLIKIEYDKKILSEEGDNFKSELVELKTLKEKYQELQREFRLVSEDKNYLQKQYDKTLQSKDSSIVDLNKYHQEQVEHHKKIFKEVEEKLRICLGKNLEFESQLEQRKNDVEKSKRSLEANQKEIQELKQRDTMSKSKIKKLEEDNARITEEIDIFKSKSKSGDQMSKSEIVSIKDELTKIQRELDSEIQKSSQYYEKMNNVERELGKSKNENQKLVEKCERHEKKLSEIIAIHEEERKISDRRIEEITLNYSNLENENKQNLEQISKLEIDIIAANERELKLSREIKMIEDKLTQGENLMKTKQQENTALCKQIENYEKNIIEGDERFNNLKNNLSRVSGDKTKNEKIIEILSKEISDLKLEAEEKNKEFQNVQKLSEQISNDLKTSKEEYLKLEIKSNVFRKEFDRFKELLLEKITNNYSQIPFSQIDLKGSIVGDSSKSEIFDNNGTSEILNKISSNHKDVKTAITKLIEQNKSLQRELSRKTEDSLTSIAKNELNEAVLVKKLEDLEEEYQKLEFSKEEESMRLNASIHELESELEEREICIKELSTQIEELTFSLNTLTLDQEANSEHFVMKQNQFKNRINEYEEKIEELTLLLQQIEIERNDLVKKSGLAKDEYEIVCGELSKREKEMKNSIEELRNNQNLLEELKKERKELLERILELELKLSTEIELKEKSTCLLEDEERKGSELKEFVSNLMKQKENAIKGDIEKSEQINNLEARLLELTRDYEAKIEEVERIRRINEDLKENAKKISQQLKDMESVGLEEKEKISKLNEKIREKEKEQRANIEAYDKIKVEYEKLSKKSSSNIVSLQNELEINIFKRESELTQLNERLNEIEKEKEELLIKNSSFQAHIMSLEESIFIEKQNADLKNEELFRHNDQVDRLKNQLKHFEEEINDLNEEIKEKEESLFQLSGKVYQLEVRVETCEIEKNEKISSVIEDWTAKYDSLSEEYLQKIENVEREKLYFKQKLEEKEEENLRILSLNRNSELEDEGVQKALEEKVKRLEEERLIIISTKNSEIQRLAEESRTKFEALKIKEAEMRKMEQDMEIANSTIIKLEQSKKETEERVKQINKVHQSELEHIKKKEAATRNSTEQLERIQWDVEREVKKTIQTYSKRIVITESKEDNQKILKTFKNLEDDVVNAISHKLNTHPNN